MLLLIFAKCFFTFRFVTILEKFAVTFWTNRKYQKKLSIQFGWCLEMAFDLTYGKNFKADLELKALLKCTELLKEMLILVIIITSYIQTLCVNSLMRDNLSWVCTAKTTLRELWIFYFLYLSYIKFIWSSIMLVKYRNKCQNHHLFEYLLKDLPLTNICFYTTCI